MTIPDTWCNQSSQAWQPTLALLTLPNWGLWRQSLKRSSLWLPLVGTNSQSDQYNKKSQLWLPPRNSWKCKRWKVDSCKDWGALEYFCTESSLKLERFQLLFKNPSTPGGLRLNTYNSFVLQQMMSWIKIWGIYCTLYFHLKLKSNVWEDDIHEWAQTSPLFLNISKINEVSYFGQKGIPTQIDSKREDQADKTSF